MPTTERVLRDADWSEEIAPGVIVGERARPIASAAIYVPCGKGSFPSVMAHLGVPAAVAGVPRVVVLCPPLRSTGRVDPAYLYIAAQLGLREVWRVNGPTGIAAAALGSASIPRVRKIVGPGSPAVTVAQLAGRGARRDDEHAPGAEREPDHRRRLCRSGPARVRPADRGRARHGLGGDAADVERIARCGRGRGDRAAPGGAPQTQREHASAALGDLGGILLCRDEAEACAFADEYAVEHLQIATADPHATLARIGHAAEILIGQNTPMAAANFTIGVPNTLPSGGYAAVSSGVTARTFLTTSSTAELSAEGLAAVGPPARTIAEYERFPAHVGALRERGL